MQVTVVVPPPDTGTVIVGVVSAVAAYPKLAGPSSKHSWEAPLNLLVPLSEVMVAGIPNWLILVPANA